MKSNILRKQDCLKISMFEIKYNVISLSFDQLMISFDHILIFIKYFKYNKMKIIKVYKSILNFTVIRFNGIIVQQFVTQTHSFMQYLYVFG